MTQVRGLSELLLRSALLRDHCCVEWIMEDKLKQCGAQWLRPRQHAGDPVWPALAALRPCKRNKQSWGCLNGSLSKDSCVQHFVYMKDWITFTVCQLSNLPVWSAMDLEVNNNTSNPEKFKLLRSLLKPLWYTTHKVCSRDIVFFSFFVPLYLLFSTC